MAIVLIRRSERIRNRAAANSMLRQTKKQGTFISSSQCKRNNKMQSPKQATSPFSTLPNDLVIEILSRLPPKTFFCCRTISKSWLSLSSDALQLNEHLRPTLGGIFYNKSYYGDCFVNLSRGANKVEVHSMINALPSFIDIFSFEKGKCTSQKELACVPMINFILKGTYAEGRVHRVTKQNKILSIDPSKCSYEVIQPPDMENYNLVGIGQSQGLLHCLYLCHKKGLLFIWVLKSYTRKEWTLKNKLNLHEIYSVLLPRFDVYHSLLRYSFLGHFTFHPEQDIMFMPVVSDDFLSLEMSTGKLKKELGYGNLGVYELLPEYYWFYVPCYLV